MYFPGAGYPHLHARLNSTGDYDRIVECSRYLGATWGGDGRNINLVRDGRAVYTAPSVLNRIPQGLQDEAAAVLQSGLPD